MASRRNLQRWWDGQKWGDQLISRGQQVTVQQARRNIKIATALWSVPVVLVLLLALISIIVYGYPYGVFAAVLMIALYFVMLAVNAARLRSIPVSV